MNKKVAILLSLAIAVVGITAVYAGEESKGTAGLQFLKMGIGARPAALGNAFVAGADDINAIYWNPAGLMGVSEKQATFMYNLWFEGINAGYLAYAQPMKKSKTVKVVDKKTGQIWMEKREENVCALGVAVTYVGYGSIPRTSENPATGKYLKTEGSFSASDFCLALSGATKLLEGIDVGIALKLISSSISTVSAFGVALDMGAIYTLKDLRIGVVVQNLGSGIRYIEDNVLLPTNFKIGASYKILEMKANVLSALVDVNIPNDNIPSVSAGVEYAYNDLIYARVGYKGAEPAGISFGGGTKLEKFLLIDYAYVPYADIGTTHRISLTVLF